MLDARTTTSTILAHLHKWALSTMRGRDHPVSIYLIEDDVLVRAGLRALLERDPALKVVGEQSDAHAAIAEVKELHPTIVILDITLDGLSGVDAVAPLKEAAPRTKILMVSQHRGSQFVQRSLKAGADGYVVKSSKPEELMLAVSAIADGDSYISPRVAAALVHRLREGGDSMVPGSALDTLSQREREVFQLIAAGRANKEVASLLNVTLSTVKKHREHLQRKLDCHSIADLTRLAIREGLLTP